jgi:microcystin-dependent protein
MKNLVLAAVLAGGAVFSAGADECKDVLSKGIYNTSTYTTDQSYRRAIDRYMYKADFRTHEEANAAGFQIGFPVYGVPIKLGGTFSDAEKSAWKSEHTEYASDHVAFHEARGSALSTVDAKLVQAWETCMTSKFASNASGLLGDVEPIGTKYVYFWVRHRPATDLADDTAKVQSFQRIGVKEIDGTSPAFVSGQVISKAVGGTGAIYEIVDKNNVSFKLSTVSHGDLQRTFSPSAYYADVNSAAQEARLQTAGFIVGEIRAFAGGADDAFARQLRAAGWLECRGQDLNVLEYPELYAAIKESWGSKAKGVSFTTPDLRGQFLRGWSHDRDDSDPDIATRVTSDGAQGKSIGSYQAAGTQTHNHSITLSSRWGDRAGSTSAWGRDDGDAGNVTHNVSTFAGVNETHPRNATVMFAIYVGRPILDSTP